MASARAANPTRAAVDTHLARAPKRKKAFALVAPKGDPTVSDANRAPAGRPPLPVVRPKGSKPKG